MTKITVNKYKITPENYRKYLKKNATSSNVIKRGDKRVQETHFCDVCGKKLSYFRLKENKYKVVSSYYKLIIGKKEIYYMCYDDRVCKRYRAQNSDSKYITLYKVVD